MADFGRYDGLPLRRRHPHIFDVRVRLRSLVSPPTPVTVASNASNPSTTPRWPTRSSVRFDSPVLVAFVRRCCDPDGDGQFLWPIRVTNDTATLEPFNSGSTGTSQLHEHRGSSPSARRWRHHPSATLLAANDRNLQVLQGYLVYPTYNFSVAPWNPTTVGGDTRRFRPEMRPTRNVATSEPSTRASLETRASCESRAAFSAFDTGLSAIGRWITDHTGRAIVRSGPGATGGSTLVDADVSPTSRPWTSVGVEQESLGCLHLRHGVVHLGQRERAIPAVRPGDLIKNGVGELLSVQRSVASP